MRRREHFRIRRYARRYDKSEGKFIVNIAYETATEITPRTIGVAEAFGLGIDQTRKFIIYDNVELKIGPKDIVYITGDSGSGKSVLLKAIKKDLEEAGESVADMADLEIDQNKPIIESVGSTFHEALALLSRVGLNDAYLFIRRYRELSDGQKYRYRIAKLMESGAQWWIMDEFAATLDRDTAKIVAYNLQKQARRMGRAVVAATTHTDLFQDLAPSVHIHKRFGREVTVHYYPNSVARECSLVREMKIERGTLEDYRRLSFLHYRSEGCPPPRIVFRLVRGEELCGVIVYAYPPSRVFGRRRAFGRSFSLEEANRLISTISRVILHPKYRSIGLGVKLVRETLPRAGTPYVEAVAVMARYNPFFEKAGMVKVAESSGDVTVRRAVERLGELGFKPYLLASEGVNLRRLMEMSRGEVERVREVLLKVSGGYYRRLKGSGKPYMRKAEYERFIREASEEALAKAIRRLAILSQTKVYLVWKREAGRQSI
ncbi:MAG: Sigma 54 interacting domain protein [Candidatus Bathyarchaeota archaeon B26-2]|nr:MAG: Sigma 54 interacting domain protein [Candidatus Bathyarchaeota archaeon B26-2]